MKIIFFIISLLGLAAIVQGQQACDYYISNAGNDTGTGTEAAPKRTIAGVNTAVSNASLLPGQILKIGLRSGDVFNETFYPGYPVNASTYFPNGARNFAILKGSKDYNSGWLPQGNNTYRQQIAINGFRGYGINMIGSYSYVYVFEIDRQLEAVAPITARRMLKFVSTPASLSATPGSFYEAPVINVDSVEVFIHTKDGLSPNNHPKYRYEVCTRDWAVNSTYQENNYFEKLWVTGYGAGNGMIPAGANTTFNRMIFGPGAGIHHLGLRGAVINNSLFLPGPRNTNGHAVVFYDVEGFRRHNTIRNSIFLDIKHPMYTHKSNGSNFGALELDNVIAFADTAEATSLIESLDTDSAFITNVYGDNYPYGYSSPWARYAAIKNCVFKDARTGISFPAIDLSATVNNNYIRISKIQNGQRGYGIYMSESNRLIISNNIVHFKNQQLLTSSTFAGYLFAGSGSRNSYANVTGNIFICDVAPGNYVVAATANTENGTGTGRDVWRNNIYILLSGNDLQWMVTNRYSNNGRFEVRNFEDWKLQSGQDHNSLFFDLRNDPRGLKAIFVDPDNGDYTLANTIEANSIRSIRAGMVNPITCFLKRPTYEEAARIIMNDAVLTAAACRNPCNRSNIRTTYKLSSNINANKKVAIDWRIDDESAVDHYEIMRSFGNNDFATIASIPATTDFNYTYTDNNTIPGITYRYSVALITKLNEKCYSSVTTVKTDDGRPVNVYPNPSTGRMVLGLNAYTGPVKITIHNVMGIKVYSKEINAAYGTPVSIDLSSEAKGFYWLQVQTNDNSTQQGFVLQ
jgi:hypothetical protein